MLEGTNFAVDLKAAMHGSELSIDLISHEKVLETEKYLATKESFSLVEASGLACKPPIELIRYGTNIGGTTQWSGKTVDFGTVIDSTATITSSEDAVVIGEVNYNAVKVEVELFLKASSDSKLSRKLVFWLAKGRGVVKRSFGNSTRAPKP